ncbi:hypothetical protein [Streptomyces orinoci]|uniref:Uncharacterized protein n=1 Tax=Streptomyces orinoci TaxID=67339 RepID=A0ABV3K7C6_STRON|nr:hypothetical protein [Streptomyces orinoci]
MTCTKADDVVRLFAQAGRARRDLERWMRHPRRGHVPEYVMQHVTAAVYRITPQDVKGLISEHAIGDIRPEQGYAVSAIKDWRPDFAFAHILHCCAEKLGGVFPYEELRRFAAQDPDGIRMLGQPARSHVEKVVASGRCTWEQARAAMQWRIGLFYYSFIREIYVLSCLREMGLDMRTHPLADALFRVDGWCGSAVLSLYIKNEEFRDGSAGRKPQAREILTDGQDLGLSFVELAMEVQRKHGVVHLPSGEQIDDCARRIKHELEHSPHDPQQL